MSLLEYKKYEPFFGAWYFDGDACTLGSGTFGSVFCIKRFDANVKPSALKIITIPKSDSEINTHRSEGMTNDDIKNYYKKMVDDIKGEYELMSELKGCSNIVSCEDFMAYQHEDGIGYDIFIRMELLTPLIQYENSRGLTELEIMKFGIDMCNALDRCESKKIIHRDIKPDNIFISDMGDFKLGDFGIARTMESSIRMMSRKGTPNYMAPEVYFSKPYDHTADIYSLGIVMYRMLNNSRLPFLPQPPATVGREEREQAFLKRIRGEVPERPVYGDEALKSIVMKACAFTSHDRYHHARDMKNDLELVYSIIKNGQEVPKQFAIDLDATVAMTNVGLNTGQIVSEDRESISSILTSFHCLRSRINMPVTINTIVTKNMYPANPYLFLAI